MRRRVEAGREFHEAVREILTANAELLVLCGAPDIVPGWALSYDESGKSVIETLHRPNGLTGIRAPLATLFCGFLLFSPGLRLGPFRRRTPSHLTISARESIKRT